MPTPRLDSSDCNLLHHRDTKAVLMMRQTSALKNNIRPITPLSKWHKKRLCTLFPQMAKPAKIQNHNPAQPDTMLELRHLRSLIAIAQTGKLSLAAKQVHLTQSALSHQLRSLEQAYGIPLLFRTRSGARFTPAGEQLLELAHTVIREVNHTERAIGQLKNESVNEELRVALECHTCFEWLMPVLDTFHARWPQINIDLVSGFHSDPIELIETGKADLVIAGNAPGDHHLMSFPLFKFEILVILAPNHRLRHHKYITAQDVEDETLITYPVPEEKIDFIREVLNPSHIHYKRRTAELTLNILQLVASYRGIAALPNWGVKSYVDYDYVIARSIGQDGLWSKLYAMVSPQLAKKQHIGEFVRIVRQQCMQTLGGITLL